MIGFIFIAIIYGLVEMFKIFFKTKFNNLIPFFAICLGLVFSLLTYIFEPTIMPITSFVSCLLFGIFCGLASIGWNQVLKHLERELTFRKGLKGNSNKRTSKRKNKKTDQVVTLKDIEFNKATQTAKTKPKETANIDLIEN